MQAEEPSASLAETSGSALPSIWAVDIAEDLILLGCDNGRVEVQQILTNLLYQCCSGVGRFDRVASVPT